MVFDRPEVIAQQAAVLPELLRPILLETSLGELSKALETEDPNLKFDRILGRNALIREADKFSKAGLLATWLKPQGMILLAETIPKHTQRLYQLLHADWFEVDLYERLVAAEEAIYQNESDPMVNWDAEDLQMAFEQAGFQVQIQVEQTQTTMQITPALLQRWFNPSRDRPTYAGSLATFLSPEEINSVQTQFKAHLGNQTVPWGSAIALLRACPSDEPS